MAYRIQNHASDIAVQNPHAGDALLLDDDSATTPSCTHVPRQMPLEELIKLFPEL